MTTELCRVIGPWLGPFTDDELTGAERLRVSRHLQECGVCRQAVDDFVGMGDLLRAAGDVDVSAVDAEGFAQGIVSRSRAEASLSWSARLRDAGDDWYWVVVGSGSLAGTVAVTLLLTAMLAFGAKPVQQDSLAGFIVTLEAPRGGVLLQTGPDLLQQDLRLVSTRGSRGDQTEVIWLRTRTRHAGRVSAVYGPEAEADLVRQLAVVAALNHPPEGDVVEIVSQLERTQGDLLDEITRLRLAESWPVPHGTGVPTNYAWR